MVLSLFSYLGIGFWDGALMMRALLIDDLRNIVATRTARTFDEGIHALEHEGPWDVLYLDHDLGDPDERKTGYGVLCWLEEHIDKLPAEIRLVTSNPSGRERMLLVIDKLYGRL